MRRSSTAALLSACCIVALFSVALAADLVNINTADSETLQTLSGIGASKAQAIIDYRTQNGLFESIEDIQNVSGIGPATYANIKDFIAVTTDAPAQPTSSGEPGAQQNTASAEPPHMNAGGWSPPPISVTLTADAVSAAGAGSFFRAQAYGTQGAPLSSASYEWNFGDGATAKGQAVFHAYAYPGNYAAIVTAVSGIASASARAAITAVAPRIRLTAQSDGSLTIFNDGSDELNVGWWMLSRAGKEFVIPAGTIVAAGGAVRLAPSILALPPGKAVLEYPNGAAAAWESADPHAAGITYLSAADIAPAASLAVAAAPQRTRPAELAVDAPADSLPAFAAVGASVMASPLWLSLAALAALLALGAGGALYARPAAAALREEDETDRLAEEFDITEG